MKKKTDAVHDAVFGSDLKALQKAIAEGCDLNSFDREGRTPLANAVIANDVNFTSILIGAGANVDAADKQGFTPLHHAAQRHSLAIVEALITGHALIDARDAFGNTPLFKAVFESRGRGEVIRALIAAGADQHLRNNSGVSPRELATKIANFDVLSLLPNQQ